MLYFVTNRKMIPEGSLVEFVERIKDTDLDKIIIREKDLSKAELESLVMAIDKIVERKKMKIIINSDYNDGDWVKGHRMHVTSRKFKESNAQYSRTVGVSVHSIEEAVEAELGGAEYILAGHVFETDCKKDLAARGLEFIQRLHRVVNIPIIAIGGIKPENCRQVIDAGAIGVAVMSEINCATDPVKVIESYVAALNS